MAGKRIDKGSYYLIEGEKDAAGRKVYHCPTCAQGFGTAGAVTMHGVWKHPETRVGTVVPTVTPTMGSVREKAYKCPRCDGSLRLLRRTVPAELLAIQAGGVFVCTNLDCEEVLDGAGSKID